MIIDQITDSLNKAAGIKLLQQLGLEMPENIDYMAGAFSDQMIIGTASLAGDTIQGVGVQEDYQGQGISSALVSHLLKIGMENGLQTLYLFTKPCNRFGFEELGFRTVAVAKPYVAMMEWGQNRIDQFQLDLSKIAKDQVEGAGCVVVNCNPFTLGHRYLIEEAAKRCPHLYVIVVEENLSEFPFPVRFRLIQEGTADLKNVTLLSGGRYVISNLTFPSYFTKEQDFLYAHTALDLTLFIQYICPPLKITKRFIGTEPFSAVTDVYNQQMLDILPKSGIDVQVINRLTQDQVPVSATSVRNALIETDLERVKKLVPETTYDFLVSPEGKAIAAQMRNK